MEVLDFNPEFKEKKGSLTLRSNGMNYSRAILNSTWHLARQQEPVDYNIHVDEKRNMSRSTYKSFGTPAHETLPNTTYQDMCEELHQLPKFQELPGAPQMLSKEAAQSITLDRECAPISNNFDSSLPQHPRRCDERCFVTTYVDDYVPHMEVSEVIEAAPDEAALKEMRDLEASRRRYVSQFTDTCGVKRPGRQTWQDESGVYGNSYAKQCTYKKTAPMADRLV